jgi:ABC-2 type transport system permease protein
MNPARGAVYDRGYRPYDGPRGGRAAAVLALYKASIRRAIGLRRPWRQKFLPLGLLAVVSVPAAVNVGIGYATRNSPLEGFSFFTYREYVGVSSALLLFVAVCAPDVICPDRRQRVLPVIFARPLTGSDYVLAKLGAIASLVFAFSILPQVLLFVGQTLVSKDGSLHYVTHHADVLWKVPAAVAALAVYYAALSLAVSSLTARRVVAGASIFGLTIISSIVAAILGDAGSLGGRGPLFNLLSMPLVVRDLIFEGHIHPDGRLAGVPGAGALGLAVYTSVVALSVAVLLWRYRWAER